MNVYRQTPLLDALADIYNKPVSIKSNVPVSGGTINETSLITLDNDQVFFLKKNCNSLSEMFQKEAAGLQAIDQIPGALRTPKVIAVVEDDDDQYLLLEVIYAGQAKESFWQEFGESFATMHKYSFSKYGFEVDNYIGSTSQINNFNEDWIVFYRELRLRFQIELAFNQKLIDRSELKRFESLLNVLTNVLSNSRRFPSLLHGDLWSGNYLVDEKGSPVLIDPAVYYGDAEADLAMTMLFGRFPDTFYKSYFEILGKPEKGYELRVEIYQLYHLLNHLNLFGKSYLPGCLAIVGKY